jgi:hypothetical protein
MNKGQRAAWLAAVLGEGSVLCAYCRYDGGAFYNGEFAEWNGCEHPLERQRDRLEDLGYEGLDCWGFRPARDGRAPRDLGIEP